MTLPDRIGDRRRRGLGNLATILLLGAVSGPVAPAIGQALKPEDAAAMTLNAGRRALNEKNYPFAAERFREFLKTFGGHKDAPSASYGLALALLEGPQKDPTAAVEALNRVVGSGDSPDRPRALYYLGLAHRGLGLAEIAQIAARPNEAEQRRNAARPRFEQAAQQFGAAIAALKDPADIDWAARARCDQAEMFLRLDKFKEAAAAVAPFQSDPALLPSRYRGLASYDLGYAAFAQKDYPAAVRALAQLAPFRDPDLGPHARFLLARAHHLAGERPEAVAGYDAVLEGYEAQRKAAEQALQNQEALKNNPEERARLEALRGQPPDYVARAAFYRGVTLCEEGQYAEALDRFNAFRQRHPQSPLGPEAQLRQGLCQVQLKQFSPALQSLQPLQQHPQLADQATWRLGQAQAGLAAEDANPQGREAKSKQAADTLRQAADRAQQAAGRGDADAKGRRGEILLDLADAQQAARQPREAAATLQQVLNENANPDRAEEALQRLATAFHLAGQLKESDDACNRYEQAHPKGTLLAAILFRRAENAYLAATAALANPNLPNRDQESKKLLGEAINRFQAAVSRYPDAPDVNLARQGMATCRIALGQFAEAVPILESIPEGDRAGDLADVPYLLADCLLHTLPAEADDALAAARVGEKLEQAIKLLDGYLGAQPTGPQAPEALIRLGQCHQRAAALLVAPEERGKTLQLARQAYEKLIQQFGNHPRAPVAVFERARCMALLGDANGAMNELNRFQADPLKNAPIAPLALLRLAELQRSQGKATEAADLLTKARAAHEGNLLKDPARADWAPLLQYQLGLALKEAGKVAEARALFEGLANQFAGKPEAAQGAWRAGQCRRDQALAQLDAPRKARANPAGARPEEVAAAEKAGTEGLKALREAAAYLQAQADQVAAKAAGSEGHLRLLQEAAGCNRVVAAAEVEATRTALRMEATRALRAEAAKAAAPGQPSPDATAPEVAPGEVPVQPAELLARGQYQAIIAAAPDAPLALAARCDLAELLAGRDDFAPAIALLEEAIEKEPTADLADRLRLQLGNCQLAKNDYPAAVAQFDAVSQEAGSALAPEARYRAAEALLRWGDWAKAAERLIPFRDQQPLQNIPDLSERAILRLGHAYARGNQWDASRQALEALANRFPNGTWADEARFGIGWAWQNQKQYDRAVDAYQQVIKRTAAEVAARAQLQTGLCRLEQKRPAEAANALLVVPFTYDYPELNALALCEAARILADTQQPRQAIHLLERVARDYPAGRNADVARRRLVGLKAEAEAGSK